MAIDTGNDKNRLKSKGHDLEMEGIKLAFDKEVLEILSERENIRKTELIQQEPQVEDVDSMYSDLSDNEPLGTNQKVANLGNGDLNDLLEGGNYNQKIADLAKAIEDRREREKEAKKQRDIKPATVEDYFKGFSSTITRKVENPKQIRSVMEEVLARKDDPKAEEMEIQRRILANNDDYME